MPTSKEEKNNDFSLFHKRNRDAFEAQVISAKKLAEIKDAIEKKSLVAALEQEKKLHQESYNDWLTKEREKIQEALNDAVTLGKSETEITQLKRDLEKDLSIEKSRRQDELAEKQRALDERITQQREKDEEKIYRIASRWAQTEYNSSSIYQRKKIQQQLKDQATSHKQEAELQRKANTEALRSLAAKRRYAVAGSEEAIALDKQKEILEKEQAKLKAQIKSDEEAASAARAEELKLTHIILDAQTSYVKDVMKNPLHLGASDLLSDVEKAVTDAQAELEKLNMEIAVNTSMEADPEVIAALEEQRAAIEESVRGFSETAESLYAVAESEKASKASKEAKEKYDKTAARSTSDMANAILDEQRQSNLEKKQNTEAQWKALSTSDGLMNKMNEAMTSALNKAVDVALDQIDQNISSFYEYQAHVEARLQGSDTSYKQALKEVTKNIGISGVVSQKDVIKNIKELSDKGIAYNLELRAFLGTVADSIANTFDAFDASLLRIIRLQQADTTAARLGMEASLTKLFNETFKDTSYLSDVFDSVSATILDASSQLARDQSVAFEYMIQKWLGSLYSLGFSQETLQTIAQGITYLGTGNVQELTANDSLNNLMATAATRIGLDYGAILVDGLDSDTTNKLLKSVVEYLQSIANNTDNNQVVKSAYTNVFGLNMTDLRAIQSLSEGDVQNIYNQSLSYDQMIKETNKQMLLTITRVPFAQMIDTAFENAMAGASTTIGNNPALYATWKVLNVVEDLTGGIDIPAISVFGSGVDLNTTVVKLAKLGVGGLGLMGSLLSSLFSGGLFGTFNVNQWDWDEYTSRGSATKGITKGSVSDVSESQEMSMNGSSSSDDVKNTSMTDAEESAQKDSKITNKNTKQYADIYEKLYAAVADDDKTVLKEAIKTNELLRESRVFKTQMNGMDALLDPYHIFYTYNVVYGSDGKPNFGGTASGGTPTSGSHDLDDKSTGGGSKVTTKDEKDPLVELITSTNDLLTSIKAGNDLIAKDTTSIKTATEPLANKLESIVSTNNTIVTTLTGIKDLLAQDRIFKTNAEDNSADGLVETLDTIRETVISSNAEVSSELTNIKELLSVFKPSNGDGEDNSANLIDTIDGLSKSVITSNSELLASIKNIGEIIGVPQPVSTPTENVTPEVTDVTGIENSVLSLNSAIVLGLDTIGSLLTQDRIFKTTSDLGNIDSSVNELCGELTSCNKDINTQLITVAELLSLDRVFKTDVSGVVMLDDGEGLSDILNTVTSILDVIISTNELLQLERLFRTSDIDFSSLTSSIDTSTGVLIEAIKTPKHSSSDEILPVVSSMLELLSTSLLQDAGDEKLPILSYLVDMLSASTVEANVAAILEKLSGETAINVITVIPPVTKDELVTLVGADRVFKIDSSSLTTLDNVNSALQDVTNSIDKSNNTVDDVYNAADSLTNSIIESQNNSQNSDIVNNQETNKTETNVSVQETQVSNSLVDRINMLVNSVEEWEMLVAKAEAAHVAASDSNNLIIPDSIQASVTTFTPEVKKQLESAIREAFVLALTGSKDSSSSEEETSLTSILQSALSSLSVRITNDFFDETLKKIAFTN